MSDGISKYSPSRVGYARVSSISQNLDSQIDALKNSGLRKNIYRQNDGFTHEQTGLGTTSGLFAYGRQSGRDGTEPDDT
ncbi:hypothetical protein LH67_20650, partial [Xenorhabdus nematophila]